MEDLTFGEQVKIILSRKKMTIKQLAELIQLETGQKMSRQNLTQRLGRDNFQEQDMRMIAAILGCPFTLNIITGNEVPAELPIEIKKVRTPDPVDTVETVDAVEAEGERDMTIGEIYEIHEDLEQLEEAADEEVFVEEEEEQQQQEETEAAEELSQEVQERPSNSISKALHEKRVRTPKDPDFEPVVKHDDLEEDRVNGDVNPYTGREYQTNSVRVHPKRIGYVQVYDRAEHSWTDMTEWAFLGYQERKKALLGKEYEPPIYLD